MKQRHLYLTPLSNISSPLIPLPGSCLQTFFLHLTPCSLKFLLRGQQPAFIWTTSLFYGLLTFSATRHRGYISITVTQMSFTLPLAPSLLYIFYTDDCRSSQHNCHLVMFAYDLVLLSLLSAPTLSHSSASSSCLKLNVNKIIVTFSSRQRLLADNVTTTIQGKPLEYRYLGTILVNFLWSSSITEEMSPMPVPSQEAKLIWS